MRLRPLETGRLNAPARLVTGEAGDGADATVTLPILSWLIEHRDGLALFDTGLHAELQRDVGRLGRTAEYFVPDFDPGEELTARLAGHGVRPSDVDLVVFSHLHFDHCGGTNEVPDARIMVQRDEWAAGQDQRLVELGTYNPDDYDLGHEIQQLDGSHDVFGDGRLVCVPTPGHTAGHQSLRVELDSGPVILTGDCIYFERMLAEMLLPRFGHDREQQLRSMSALARLRDEEGCRLLYGHDESQLRTLPADGLS